MANEREISSEIHMYYSTDDNVEEESSSTHESETEENKPSQTNRTRVGGKLWFSGGLLDPRSKCVQEWNIVFLLVCAVGLFVDPIFFYSLSIGAKCLCVYIDGWFALSVTVLRFMADVFHVLNMLLQFKMANRFCYGGYTTGVSTDLKNGPPWIVLTYLKSRKGFLLDLLVMLPIPQFVIWVIVPSLLEKDSITLVMTVFLIFFLFQYIPKVYHVVCLLRRMQNLSGYIFGTVWWGIALNMLAYFVASNAAGACWYLLGLQRSAKCLKEQCSYMNGCDQRLLGFKDPFFHETSNMLKERARLAWARNKEARTICLESGDINYYGSYKWVVELVTIDNRLVKILFPMYWGLMTLSTFGNLESTTEWIEVIFNIIVPMSGLLLFTMLIGNFKLFIHATTSKKQGMQLKMRKIEWWMKKRHLPQGFRRRVRNYERHHWAATRGVDESQMISDLPEGLTRDIKYHLCVELVKQVPLFHHMDNLVLENICTRVKPLIFTKGETITREGDPVQRMLFVVRGHLETTQTLRDGVTSCCMLGPGNFSGDELLTWCLRKPFVERLPPSSSTLITLQTIEVFSLEAADLKYVSQHFRYTFVNERVKRSTRFYSTGWRTWAAVCIQLAWRRHKYKSTLTSLPFVGPRRHLSRSSSTSDDRLRLYAAMLTSAKPDQYDFDV